MTRAGWFSDARQALASRTNPTELKFVLDRFEELDQRQVWDEGRRDVRTIVRLGLDDRFGTPSRRAPCSTKTALSIAARRMPSSLATSSCTPASRT